ncbi:MAG: CapA family protein [Chloroflexi bacterium]|nr:CapA family protein [Chloroflexota bacterium]
MRGASNERAWLVWFWLGAFSFGLSMMVLGLVVAGALDDNGLALAGSTPAATTEATIPAGEFRYTGVLPAALDPARYLPADAGHKADLDFRDGTAADGEAAAVTRYWVPVASLSAGVDSLTMAQIHLLFAGDESVTWAGLGGVGGKPGLVEAGPPADRDALAMFRVPAYRDIGSYDELFRQLAAADSGLAAMVPLDQLKLGGVALAVDGVDLVRGKGDPAAWPFVQRTVVTGLTDRGRAAAPAIAEAIRAKLPAVTRVVATGDILQSRCTLAKIEETGDWGSALRGPMAAYLAGADLALGSLDGSIQDAGAPYLCVEGITNLTSPPEVMEALTLAGFDELTVATNHVFDCGQVFCGTEAFTQTLDRLRAAGIKTAGGGKDLEEALAPAIFDVNGVRFGVLGFDDVAAMDLEATDTAPGTAPLDDDYSEERRAGEPAFYRPASELELTRFADRIRQLKTQVDIVIVQVQTGTENTHDPTDRSIKALRTAADAGAGLVIGNQAHWAQAVEVRGGAFIAYALGNFIFDQVHTPEFTQGYLVESTFHGKRLVDVRLVPYQIEERYRPTFATGDLRAKILGDVFGASKLLATR